MPTRTEIIETARRCVDTPFRHQGRLVGVGLDCAGVLVYIGRQHPALQPAPEFNPTAYSRFPNQVEVRRHLRSALDPVPNIADRRPADVLLLVDNEQAAHMGILARAESGEYETLIHATEREGKVVEHILDDFWLRRICAVYRFRGLAD
jgi:cell wall-associated NlpC family hydrolase